MALFGIYGRHEIADCPLNNEDTAKMVITAGESDMSVNLPQYKIHNIVGQFHSGLEHTFLWIVDAEDAHLIQQWAIETGIAKFNEVKIVPLITFEQVIQTTKKVWGQ